VGPFTLVLSPAGRSGDTPALERLLPRTLTLGIISLAHWVTEKAFEIPIGESAQVAVRTLAMTPVLALRDRQD
jgi:hypothetical protein